MPPPRRRSLLTLQLAEIVAYDAAGIQESNVTFLELDGSLLGNLTHTQLIGESLVFYWKFAVCMTDTCECLEAANISPPFLS